jgi:hypothetical protein
MSSSCGVLKIECPEAISRQPEHRRLRPRAPAAPAVPGGLGTCSQSPYARLTTCSLLKLPTLILLAPAVVGWNILNPKPLMCHRGEGGGEQSSNYPNQTGLTRPAGRSTPAEHTQANHPTQDLQVSGSNTKKSCMTSSINA